MHTKNTSPFQFTMLAKAVQFFFEKSLYNRGPQKICPEIPLQSSNGYKKTQEWGFLAETIKLNQPN